MDSWTALDGQEAYSGSFQIPSPKGVYQAEGDTNINAEYAYRAENMRTERGLLASAYGTSRAFPSVGVPVETLTRFHRRTRPDDPEVLYHLGRIYHGMSNMAQAKLLKEKNRQNCAFIIKTSVDFPY